MTPPNIRQAQVISPNGVGAIVDVSGQSFVVESTTNWFRNPDSRTPISAPRLSQALRINRLLAPPETTSGQFGRKGASLPVRRFPAWLFCGSCRKMVQWRPDMEDSNPHATCPSCKAKKQPQQLVPMRWIQICRRGHLGDVDWVWFAHAGTRAGCVKRDGLLFRTSGAGGAGLASVEVRCSYCDSHRSLSDISEKGVATRLGMKCTGRHPWEGYDRQAPPECSEEPVIVQRRASNVYYSEVTSAIEVPITSLALPKRDMDVLGHTLFPFLLEQIRNGNAAGAEQFSQVIAASLSHDVGEVNALAHAALASSNDSNQEQQTPETLHEIAESEWSAFTRDEPYLEPDFVTRPATLAGSISLSPASRELARFIPRITLADTLREVRAFRGFRRVTPGQDSTFVRADGRHFSDKPSPTWLPAVEVRGEGIFLSLDDTLLQGWEARPAVIERVAELSERAQASFMWDRLSRNVGDDVTPRYVLLHTLAHLLIRRLAFESGYGSTSLRERIYARSDNGIAHFSGLLIYTAAGDAEGTLGGLVRQGEPSRLRPALLGALEDAAWCSSDPLCGEQHSTSFDGLNLASCHACTLVSETSCENGNYLLDRALLVGPGTGFFASVVGVGQSDRK